MPSTTLTQTYNLPLLTATISGISGGGNTFTLLAGTIPVNSTNGFPTSGILEIPANDTFFDGVTFTFIIHYTNITTTSFTGCTLIDGNASNYIVNNQNASYIGGGGVGSISVASTAGFPSVGQLQINGNVYVNYQGINGNTFTGINGGGATISSGQTVTYWAQAQAFDVNQAHSISSPTDTPLHNDSNNEQGNTWGASTNVFLTSENFNENNLPEANSWGNYDMDNTRLLADPNFYANVNYDPLRAVNFKMRGFYVAGQVYETWIVQGMPNTNPPSGHVLTNIIVEEIY